MWTGEGAYPPLDYGRCGQARAPILHWTMGDSGQARAPILHWTVGDSGQARAPILHWTVGDSGQARAPILHWMLEEIGNVYEVLQRIHRARRDIAQQPRQRVDRRLRNRVA